MKLLQKITKQLSLKSSKQFTTTETTKSLLKFLKLPLASTKEIFEIFEAYAERENLVTMTDGTQNEHNKWLYIQGTKPSGVCLVAHADTVFMNGPNLKITDTIISSNSDEYGIGADDRAGVALIWMVKELGHSILITDGEEIGMVGASKLASVKKYIDYINDNNAFFMQIDRRNNLEYKHYGTGNKEFESYIENKFGYINAGNSSFTDIVVLSKTIPGVNISACYYNEHTCLEYIDLIAFNALVNKMYRYLSTENFNNINFSRSV